MNVDSFRIAEGETVDLGERATSVEPVYESKKRYKKLLKQNVKRLAKLQYGLYAANTHSLLVIFQAMDAGGKDSCIRRVMSGINPQGCQVFSFNHPSTQEQEHDFLWRSVACLPERGNIGVFNRSYYEEVLIVRVHPEILQAESPPPEASAEESIWEGRYKSIRDFERHLHLNGTRVIKFFLHISKEEQRHRFIERIEQPEKNWKFDINDIAERGRWDEYMDAYARCLSATSTHYAPWYAIPADDKRNAHLLVSEIIAEALNDLESQVPVVTDEHRQELEIMLAKLTEAGPDR